MDPHATIIRHKAEDGATHVDQDTFEFLHWPQGAEHWLWTSGLNGCLAIAIVSKEAGVLWHFAGLPPRGHPTVSAMLPGTAYVDFVAQRITDLYQQNKEDFEYAELFIVASRLPEAVHPGMLANNLIDRLRNSLRLHMTVIDYPILMHPQPRPPYYATLEIQARGNKVLPKVYFNGEHIAGYTYRRAGEVVPDCQFRHWSPIQYVPS